MLCASVAACTWSPPLTCPDYPDTPESTLLTLERAARTDPATGQYLIDQSRLADKLDACGRQHALGEIMLRPRD
jgi:hypothetical protein